MRPLTKKHRALVVILLVLVAGGGIVYWAYEANRTIFRLEEEYYGGRPARTLIGMSSALSGCCARDGMKPQRLE